MSEDDDLAPEVLHFVGVCIPTVPHLEALLLMWETAPTGWTAAEIAARIYVAPDTASQILRDLERCGVIEKDGAQAMPLRFNARSEWASTLPLVFNTYRRQLSRVARYIHSQGPKSVREFSRAFRLRRDQ